MLRQFLIIWLIVSTLGYGTVWAMDTHWNENSQYAAVQDGDVSSQDDNKDGPFSDHCCHGIIHLLGILPATTIIPPSVNTKLETPLTSSHHPWAAAPPLQPPRS